MNFEPILYSLSGFLMKLSDDAYDKKKNITIAAPAIFRLTMANASIGVTLSAKFIWKRCVILPARVHLPPLLLPMTQTMFPRWFLQQIFRVH